MGESLARGDRNLFRLCSLWSLMRLLIGIWVCLVALGAAGAGVAAPLERGPLLDQGVLPAPTPPLTIASSGRTLVAGAEASAPLGEHGAGAAYVYEKAGSVWSGEAPAARLEASDGVAGDGFGRAVAMSGSTVAVLAAESGAVYVYSEPPGGWSGVLHESAKLVLPAGLFRLFPEALAMTGSLVGVLSGDGVHLYRRPSSGWSGVITESAVLSPGDGFVLAAAAVSDRAITEVGVRGRGRGASYVEHWSVDRFRPVSGGWSGVISPTARATLVSPRNVYMRDAAFTGRTIVVLGESLTSAAYLFAEPKAGWAGSVRATSKTPGLPVVGEQRPVLSVSPTRVMIDLVDASAVLIPRVSNRITVFDKPAGGWPAIIPATTTLELVGDGDPELDDEEILMPGPEEYYMGPAGVVHFRIEPPAEVTTGAELSGMTGHSPQLTLALQAGAAGAPLSHVTLTLPRGLRLNSQHLTRTHLSTIPRAARPSVSSTDNALTVTLGGPTPRVSLTVSAGAISLGPGLRRELARLQRSANRRHRTAHLSLTVAVQLTDTAAVTTTRQPAITLTLRPHHRRPQRPQPRANQ